VRGQGGRARRGQGVFVCDTSEEALAAVDRIMVREEFGRSAGRQIIIERRLDGEELSLMALVAGRAIVTLASAQDYKRAFDGDTGPNTGGMGAYSPAPVATPALLDDIEAQALVPTVHALKRRRQPFRGALYAGAMVTSQGPRILEYNCRFGDPETQPVLMRLQTDLCDLLEAVVDDRLGDFAEDQLQWDPRPAVCVVIASGGYPGNYAKGKVIRGLDRSRQAGRRQGLPRRHQIRRRGSCDRWRPRPRRHRPGRHARRRQGSRL